MSSREFEIIDVLLWRSLIVTAAHRRHDISDPAWELLSPHLPGREGAWGGKARQGAARRRTIDGSSTQYSGFYARERRGVICRRITGIGKTRIGDFAAGCWGMGKPA
jgi:hypothetical protein